MDGWTYGWTYGRMTAPLSHAMEGVRRGSVVTWQNRRGDGTGGGGGGAIRWSVGRKLRPKGFPKK